MNILIINGHEYWENSPGVLNASLVRESESLLSRQNFSLKSTIIDKGYEVEEEVDKFLWADIILYFTPVYWFDIPSGFKTYIEKVFSGGKKRLFVDDGCSTGGEYGTGGLMKAKRYMLFTTWNAPEHAFNHSKAYLFEGKNVDDVFLGFHSAQKFIGIKMIMGLNFFDVKRKPDFKRYKSELAHHLKLHIT